MCLDLTTYRYTDEPENKIQHWAMGVHVHKTQHWAMVRDAKCSRVVVKMSSMKEWFAISIFFR